MPSKLRLAKASVVLLVAGTASSVGCSACRRMAGNDVVVLDTANVQTMTVDLRRPVKTICPREPVQMAVHLEILFPEAKGPQHVETWEGRGRVNKNDKLDFAELAFASGQGTFDAEGWFHPEKNLLATAGQTFDIRTVLRRRPDKFTLSNSYKPDYTCITKGGVAGAAGQAAVPAGEGAPGSAGSTGSSTTGGGAGGEGGPGVRGGRGTDGGRGPTFNAYATMVKTPFYERLVGIVINGDVTDFLLVPEGQPITLVARGGDGGAGGQGGRGGAGGRGGDGNPPGTGGNGGLGGDGGQGGNGGDGGMIDLMVDPRFPALRGQIQLDVGGGAAGAAGPGGAGGAGGQGGAVVEARVRTPRTTTSSPPAPAGNEGQAGANGGAGTPGRAGSAHANLGNVSDMFQGRAQITPL